MFAFGERGAHAELVAHLQPQLLTVVAFIPLDYFGCLARGTDYIFDEPLGLTPFHGIGGGEMPTEPLAVFVT